MRSFAVFGTLVLVQILAGCGDESSSGEAPRDSGPRSGTGARTSLGGTESGGAGAVVGSGGSDIANAGAPNGDAASGGIDTGGVTTGGTGSGGVTTGGTNTGGVTTGGTGSGGVTTGGIGSGGVPSGGTAAGGTGGVNLCAVPEEVAEEDLLDLTMAPIPAGCGSATSAPRGSGGVFGPIPDADTLRDALSCDESVTFDIDFTTHAVVCVWDIVSPPTGSVVLQWATLDDTTLHLVYSAPPYCGGVVPLVATTGCFLVPAAATELDAFNCNRSSCGTGGAS